MKKKILIVEDQPDIRALIRITLESEDYDIVEAASGEQGLAAARSMHPDLVLLDVMMPGALNGLQVCEQIKLDPSLKNTVVAMLTARGQDTDRQAAKRVGADDYLVKPFGPRELMSLVVRHLG